MAKRPLARDCAAPHDTCTLKLLPTEPSHPPKKLRAANSVAQVLPAQKTLSTCNVSMAATMLAAQTQAEVRGGADWLKGYFLCAGQIGQGAYVRRCTLASGGRPPGRAHSGSGTLAQTSALQQQVGTSACAERRTCGLESSPHASVRLSLIVTGFPCLSFMSPTGHP